MIRSDELEERGDVPSEGRGIREKQSDGTDKASDRSQRGLPKGMGRREKASVREEKLSVCEGSI